MQKGLPQDSSSGSGPNSGWALTLNNRSSNPCSLSDNRLAVVEAELTISWLACNNFARGFSVSPWRVNETIKLRPNFDLREIVGLVSSAERKEDGIVKCV